MGARPSAPPLKTPSYVRAWPAGILPPCCGPAGQRVRLLAGSMVNDSDDSSGLRQELAAALAQLRVLGLKVAALEARLGPDGGSGAHKPAAPQPGSLDFLGRHSQLVLPQPKPGDRMPSNGSSAAERLRQQREGRGPQSPRTAASGAVPRPFEAEVAMAATRMVMAQIVSPADSNGLDICNVSERLHQAAAAAAAASDAR